MLRIGVLLPSRFEDAGDFLADARALDAAGADSLWVDGDGHEPWLILAAIASVTGRVRLVAPVSGGRAGASLESDVRTLERLSRGRLALKVDGPSLPELPPSVAGSDARRIPVLLEAKEDQAAAWPGPPASGLVFAGGSPAACRVVRESISGGGTSPIELWALLPSPQDRAEWNLALREYEEAGASGVLVPAGPRLLDMLRNAGEDEDRSDLSLSQG
jgi:alkanesulfonate monooxygenase SsuD/methylene tetrahydromethanopterin reductase-like flavin-dependent oxidoreductase (luciferase family)